MRFKKGNRWRGSKGQIRYKTWRKMVFERNKGRVGLSKYYVCVKCNKKRETTRVLHAHHIFSWHNYPKLRYEMKNGIVLCNIVIISFIDNMVISFLRLIIGRLT